MGFDRMNEIIYIHYNVPSIPQQINRKFNVSSRKNINKIHCVLDEINALRGLNYERIYSF